MTFSFGTRDRRVGLLALAVLLVPLVVAAFVLLVEVGDDYMPISDRALMELKTRDVGLHPVLTGLYSRDGWSHPGPAVFYLLAVPYRLVGGRAIGLPLGALAINAAAIAGIVVIARRRGGVPLMLFTVVGCGLLMRALGADFLRDDWSPFVAVLPFGLLILLAWEMCCGTTWALPVGAVLAAFCTQAHVGYVTSAYPLLLWGAVWLVVLAKRSSVERPDERVTWRPLAYSAVVAVAITIVMWIPPLVEQFTHSPGNLTTTIDWFRDAREGVHSFGDGLRIVASQFELRPPWIMGRVEIPNFVGEPAALSNWRFPVYLVPFALSPIVFWRLRQSEALRLVATLWFLLALAVVSVSRTVGTVYEYRLRWLWVVAMFAAVVTVWSGWMLIPDRWSRRAGRGLIGVALAATVTLGVVNSVAAARAGTPNPTPTSPPLAGLVGALERHLPRRHGDIVFAGTTSPIAEYYVQGLVSELERRGLPARVSEDVSQRFGDHRVHDPSQPTRARLTIADGQALLEQLERPDAELLAYAGPTPRVLARRLERSKELAREYRAGDLTFDEALRRQAKLNLQAIGVFRRP